MLFDDILRKVGEFGPFQIVVYFLLGAVGIPTAFQNLSITFLGAEMDHFCKIEQLQNFSYDQQKYIAIPIEGYSGDGQPKYHNCEIYDLDYGNYSVDDFLSWDRAIEISNSTRKVTCEAWIYDQSVFYSTFVNQMDLVCTKKWMLSLIQTIYMSGFLIGCLVIGQVSDRFGRKKTLIATLIGEIISLLIATFMDHYVAYAVFKFFGGLCVAGSFTTAFVISMEIIGPKYRVKTGVMFQGLFAVGLMILPYISYGVRDHVKLQFIMALTPSVLIIAAFIIPESPRWLVSVGRDEEAEKILRYISKVNGTELPDKLNLQENRQEEKKENERKPMVLDLLKTPRLRLMTLNMWFAWLVTSLGYYGLSLGVSLLQGSIFFNTFLSGLVEIPSYIITLFVLDRIGRRWPTIATFLGGGIFCLICMGLIGRQDMQIALITCLMIGKALLAATFAILYVYAAELFPTVVRQVGVGSSSMCARIGSLVQPQVALLNSVWQPGPFLVYGALSGVAGITSFFLPETLGMTLPETIDDGENFGKKRGSKVLGASNGGYDDIDDYSTKPEQNDHLNQDKPFEGEFDEKYVRFSSHM